MLRIFIFEIVLVSSLITLWANPGASATDNRQKLMLKAPRKTLFKHEFHVPIYESEGVLCTDCHNFTIHPSNPNLELKKGLIVPPRLVCHECHKDRLNMPVPRDCTTCHTAERPKDHLLNWKQRHGRFAQFDRDTCMQCHSLKTCDGCHLQKDSMNPKVHPANFRLFHSVQARAKPASCNLCHKNSSFCRDCHRGTKTP